MLLFRRSNRVDDTKSTVTFSIVGASRLRANYSCSSVAIYLKFTAFTASVGAAAATADTF